MTQLYFLIAVFLVAILLSFYFATEAFYGTVTTDPSGNTVMVTDNSGNRVQMPPPGPATDVSGNVISSRLKDLISVMTQSNLNVAPASASAPPTVTTPQPIAQQTKQEPTLDQYYESLKPIIQKDVAQAVQQQFERSTVLPKAPSYNQAITTPSVAQGAMWPKPRPRPQPGCGKPEPDMNDYVRKDAIPCWGCTLDY